MHTYDFHIGDYIKHTAHLSNDEDLCYRRLLDLYYDTERPIPLDITYVCRRVRLSSDVVKTILSEYFYLTGDGYRSIRCDAELEKIYGRSDTAKHAAEVRWDNYRKAKAMQTHTECNADAMPPTTHLPTNPLTHLPNKPDSCEQAFDPKNHLLSIGIDKQVVTDWLKLRKKKKAEVTLTAIQGIQNEADKAFVTLEDALRYCCQQGWQGFKAEWLKGQNLEYKSRIDKLAETGAALGGYSTAPVINGQAIEINRSDVYEIPNLLRDTV